MRSASELKIASLDEALELLDWDGPHHVSTHHETLPDSHQLAA
jgi:hypothetical protein